MARTGRPKKEIDWSEFAKLCFIQCTLEEIAGFFDVSIATIERACKREFKMTFADVFKQKSAGGHISIRRAQYQVAAKGNATMLIWLGKQWLNQSDKVETKSELSVNELKDLKIAWEDESGDTAHAENAQTDAPPKAH